MRAHMYTLTYERMQVLVEQEPLANTLCTISRAADGR